MTREGRGSARLTDHVVAVNHVGVSVADLDRATQFWRDGLGALDHGAFSWPVGTLPADESLATEQTAADVVLLRTEAAFLELFAFSSPTPRPRPPDAPGVRALTWAVDDVATARARALAHAGTLVEGDVVGCPDGTPVRLVPAGEGPRGLVGVHVHVADAAASVFAPVAGPVHLQVAGGASTSVPAAVDLGVNHLCLDVADPHACRAAGASVTWHHPVTESSGGLAAVCYGTSADGVMVELLESRSPEAFFSRTRLERP